MSNSNTEAINLMISTTALILLLTGFIITILFHYQKKQFAFQQNLEEIKLSHEKDILQTQLEIQERTLQSVSREIHDNIALGLTLSKLHLNTLNYPGPVSFEEKINSSINLISEAIQNLSNISKSLSADVIQKYGLLKALQNEINNLQNTGLFRTEYQVTGTPLFLESKTELVIFRIIQESFNNIIKHSQSTAVLIHLHYCSKELQICIRDDGKGFSAENGTRLKKCGEGCGLNNMQQRAKTISSDCQIISKAGEGTLVRLTVPLPANEQNCNHG